MAESHENVPEPKYEWRNVFVGTNPDTGKKYFERRKVRLVDPNEPPEDPPEQNNDPERRNVGNYNADIVSKYLDDKADRDSED